MTTADKLEALLTSASKEPVTQTHLDTPYSFVSGCGMGGRMKQADARLYVELRNNVQQLIAALRRVEAIANTEAELAIS